MQTSPTTGLAPAQTTPTTGQNPPRLQSLPTKDEQSTESGIDYETFPSHTKPSLSTSPQLSPLGSQTMNMALLSPTSRHKLEPLGLSPRREGSMLGSLGTSVKLPPIDSDGVPLCTVEDALAAVQHAQKVLPPIAPSDSSAMTKLEGAESEEDQEQLTCFGKWQKMLNRLVSHPAFDAFIIVMILLNCFFMTLEDPTATEETQSNFAKNVMPWIELTFACIFTFELVAKCSAWGIMGYMKDNWNRLDSVIVAISWLSIFGDSIGNLSSLRALRVLKPLRTVNKLPQLKLLITTLFLAGPHLALAATMYLALFLIYGCIGLQIWGLEGAYHNRCYHDYFGTIQDYEDDGTICSKESAAFNACPEAYTCRQYEKNPNYGVTGFDNIFQVILVVFQVIALEGWTTLLYMTMDNSANVIIYLAIIFFISAVIMGGFLAANLFLAILKNQFAALESEHDAEEIKKGKARKEQERRIAAGEIEPEEWQPEWWQCMCCKPSATVAPETEGAEAEKDKWEEPGACGAQHMWAKKIAFHPKFDHVFMSLILINVIVLMLEYHDMPFYYEKTLEYINLTLSIIFIIECIVKTCAMSFPGYWQDDFNKFDFVLVLFSVFELIAMMAAADGGFSFLKAFRLGRVMKIARVLRLTRALRVVRMAKFVAPLRKILAVIQITVPALGSVSIVVVLAVFFFAILGMQMFGGKFCVSNEYNSANYDSFFRSTLSVFAVITLDDWPTQMYNASEGTSPAAIVYFVMLIVVGNFIVFNLLLAVMLTCFEKPVEVLEETEEEKLLKDLIEIEGGKGLMMSWEMAQDKLARAEARVEQALVNAVTTAQQKGEGVEEKEEDLAEYYRTGQVPAYMREAYDRIKEAARDVDAKEEEQDQFTAIEEELNVEDVPPPPAEAPPPPPLADDTFEEDHEMPPPPPPKPPDSDKESDERETSPAPSPNKSAAATAAGAAEDEGAEGEDEEEGFGFGEIDDESDEEADGPTGSTLCGLFKEDNPLRQKIWDLAHSEFFTNWVLILILLSCVQLAWETYVEEDEEPSATILLYLDYILTISFTCEMTTKILSNGLYEAPDAYLKSSANCLDGFIVCMSLLTMVLSNISLGFIKSLRALRCIRPLRVLSRSKNMMCVLQALVRSIPGIANIALFFLVVFIVFGILGGNFFSGQNGGFCLDYDIEFEADCEGSFIKDGCTVDREWYTTSASFNNIGASILTLLEVCTLEGWSGYMYFFMFKLDSPLPAFFFIVWVLVSAFFMLNLFIGIVFQEFQKASEGPSGFAMLTPEQQEWVMSTRNLFAVKPRVKRVLPDSGYRRSVILFVEHDAFENFIAFMIAANVLVLLVAFYQEPSYWTQFQWVAALTFNIVFFFEMLLKVIGYGWKDYSANGWNKFDFFLVCASLVDILMDIGVLPNAGPLIGVLRVFRIFRVARMMRLAKNLGAIRKMASVLLVSMPSIVNVGSLLLLFFFMFGVLGCSFFKDVTQDGDGVTRHANFSDLGMSMLTLFRVSTGEDWNQIMHDCIDQGHHAAPIYFVTFNILVMFVLINVFVACVVDNMKVSQGEPVSYETFAESWYRFDEDATMWIDADLMTALLFDLGEPLGCSREMSTKEILLFIDSLNVPSHQGRHHFNEVLYCLARNLGGVALPPGTLVDTIDESMKETFPVYQREAEGVITASQRLSVFKFLMKLKQDILLRKLEEHEAGQEWKSTAWSLKNGLTAEELLAGAKILKYIRQMVHSQDPIRSEPLHEERALLLDPSEESQKRYDKIMRTRRKSAIELTDTENP